MCILSHFLHYFAHVGFFYLYTKIMGCDIHFHVEVKINNKWEHYTTKPVERNYNLFSKMANVRNAYKEIMPISKPKGLPSDSTVITELSSSSLGSDGHSHSWLSSKEVLQLYCCIHEEPEKFGNHETHELFGWFFGNEYAGFFKYKEDYPEEIEDYRFVFFFDN